MSMFKKTKLYVAVSMVVQAVSALIMFFVLLGKHKGIAGAFLALAAMTGATGAYLLYDCREELGLCADGCDCDCDCDCCDDDCDCDCDCDCGCCEEEENPEDDMNVEGNLFSRNDEE